MNVNFYLSSCTFISLGEQQENVAQKQLIEAIEQGDWIVFENCHLMCEWMPYLERLYIKQMKSERVHEDFRWWFVIEPMDSFPLVILRDAVKFVYQNPPGITQNMVMQYKNGLVDRGDTFSIPTRVKWYRFAFALNAFHAIIRERCQHEAIGWSGVYDFNETLLYGSVDYLHRMLKLYDDVPYEDFFYLINDCLYANEIIDLSDRRLLKTLLQRFCCPQILDQNKNSFLSGGLLSIPEKADPESAVNYLKGFACNVNDVGLHDNTGHLRSTRSGQKVSVGIFDLFGEHFIWRVLSAFGC